MLLAELAVVLSEIKPRSKTKMEHRADTMSCIDPQNSKISKEISLRSETELRICTKRTLFPKQMELTILCEKGLCDLKINDEM